MMSILNKIKENRILLVTILKKVRVLDRTSQKSLLLLITKLIINKCSDTIEEENKGGKKRLITIDIFREVATKN